MFLQPQRPQPARSGVGSLTFGRKNSSVASFTSSSNDGYDAEGSGSASMRQSQSLSQSGSSRGHTRNDFDPPSNRSTQLSASSDADYAKPTTQRKRADSKGAKDASAPPKSSGVGTLRGLGRRLFNRSSSNLKAAPILTSRSQSASSSSTGAQSPPLTPTTPPHVQPVWLANGQKDFFSNFSNLPSNVNLAQHEQLRTPADSYAGVSPKSKQGAFNDAPQAVRDHTFDSGSSQGHASSSIHSHSSAFALPALPSAVASPAGFGSQLSRREIPAVIEEEADSDFLRAVLNFGDGDTDMQMQTPSFRGGRAAPLPTRSSSLGQIAGATSSPSSFTLSSPAPPPPRRTSDGRVILTQDAARTFANDKPAPAYVVVHRKYRRGLFGNDSESEDEYGDDDEERADHAPIPASPAPEAANTASQGLDAARYPSSFAKARTMSPSNDPDESSNTISVRPAGLDSAAKKALYNCTLLKVHAHLASTLAGDAEARAQIPVIAAGEVLYANDDLRFPRSINDASKLRGHSSTHAFSRSLHVALARTEVMRKLRRDKLRIEDEVEISWFQRKYGSAGIAPELIAKALRQRQMVSPEALAKPPIAAPHDSTSGGLDGLAASRRLSGIVSLEPGQKVHAQGDKNGIITWAHRPSYLARTAVWLPADEFAPGELVVAPTAQHAVQEVPASARRGSAWGSSAVSYSPRIRVLAGLPSVQEERRLKYPPTRKFRPRDMQSKHASRMMSASDSAVWEGPNRRSSSRPARESPLASPSGKPKRLPPWMAPRTPQLLSPRSPTSPSHDARSVSEGAPAFSTLHANGSAVSIPEVSEAAERGADSSDEEVPLAQLQTFRAHRAAEKERIQQLEREVATLRLKEQTREREEEDRKAREEEARRLEAERAYEERKAAAEARRLEKNRKILQEARDRRGFTRQSVLLAEPNYGAGNPLLGQHRPGLKQVVTSSPSSPVLAGEASSTVGRAVQHDAALAKLQGTAGAGAPRSPSMLYAQHEAQRRSRSSVAAVEPVVSPVASPRVRASPSASPLMDVHRQSSMASLVPPSAIPHQRSMGALPVSPQITQRRASLLPPTELHHATSMQQLPMASPMASPMMAASQSAFLRPDPRHSMSMTSLHAHAYMQAQQMQQAQHMMHPQAHMHAVQRPGAAQTVKVSSRTRAPMPPLVSLYGDVVPSSATQRRS